MTEIKFNVLIAEDEENIGNFISAILKTNGYKPIIATTGNQAIQCAESYCPDVILLDLGLPDMDGIDVISEIRKWAVTPIIVISARNRLPFPMIIAFLIFPSRMSSLANPTYGTPEGM